MSGIVLSGLSKSALFELLIEITITNELIKWRNILNKWSWADARLLVRKKLGVEEPNSGEKSLLAISDFLQFFSNFDSKKKPKKNC